MAAGQLFWLLEISVNNEQYDPSMPAPVLQRKVGVSDFRHLLSIMLGINLWQEITCRCVESTFYLLMSPLGCSGKSCVRNNRTKSEN